MKKRLITGMVLLMVMLLAATTIVLGFVQIDSKPELGTPSEITFRLTTGQTRTVSNVDGVSEGEKKLYDNLYEAYNEMFNYSLLTGIFTGKLGEFQIREDTRAPEVLGNKITFSYLQNQTLTVNGEIYYSIYRTTKKFEYRTVEFSISEEDSFGEFKMAIYLVDTSGTSFYAEIITMANTSKMYNVINDYYNA